MLKPLVAALLVAAAVGVAAPFAEAPPVQKPQGVRERAEEWPFYGADQGGMKYSPLADVNTSNVSRLAPAWQWSTG